MTLEFILPLHLFSWSRNQSRSATNHKMQGQSAWPMTGLIEPQPISPFLLRD